MVDDEEFITKVWLVIWRTGVQLFYLAVILLIFDQIHTAAAELMMALAGIIYATIRTGFLGLLIYHQTVFVSLGATLDRLQFAADIGSEPDMQELYMRVRKARTPMYFEMVGLSLVYFLCLFKAFDAVGNGAL